jgi:hypothetical protein
MRSTIVLGKLTVPPIQAARSGSGGAAVTQRLDDDADCAGRTLRMRKVRPDQRMVRIEPFGRAVQAVAVLGHGQADDADRGTINGVQKGGGRLPREDHIGQRADDGHGLFGGIPLHQRIQMILRPQTLLHPPIGWHQAGTDDAPGERVWMSLH